MSYQIGIGGGMERLGFSPRDPAIVCDGCGMVRRVVGPRSMGPPKWFLDSKPPPGWKGERSGDKRFDYCPQCWEKD